MRGGAAGRRRPAARGWLLALLLALVVLALALAAVLTLALLVLALLAAGLPLLLILIVTLLVGHVPTPVLGAGARRDNRAKRRLFLCRPPDFQVIWSGWVWVPAGATSTSW